MPIIKLKIKMGDDVLKPLVGMKYCDAVRYADSNGFSIRARKVDGKGMVGTADFRNDRINVSIVKTESESANLWNHVIVELLSVG